MIVIRRNFRIKEDQDTLLFINRESCKGYIRRSLLGYVDSDEVLGSQRALGKLINYIQGGNDVTNFMKWSIGRFFVIIVRDHAITMFTSPKGPGFFYYTKNSNSYINTEIEKITRECAN